LTGDKPDFSLVCLTIALVPVKEAKAILDQEKKEGELG
jgi:hypothetical protein